MERLTLSVVSHGHGPMLARLLRDLAALPELSGACVIVTLNLPGEAFDAALFEPLKIQMICNDRPRGFGANHNAAFARCDTPWFAILNPDIRIHDDPFPSLFDAATRWPDAALIGPRVINSEGLLEDSVRTNLSPWSLVSRRLLGIRRSLQVRGPARAGERFYWIAGMFMLLRADAFGAVGGFDERYFMYCEDYDLCARIYLSGHGIVLASEATVVHAAQRASHRSLRHLRWHLASLGKVWRSTSFWRVTLKAGH